MKSEVIKVLIVDDHQLIIDGIKSLLSNVENIEIVAEANNGKEALKVLENTSINIVLMDIEMPVMNGWDTTKEIISNYSGIKVIALSTFSEKTIVKKMMNAGASGYILKNIKKDVLIEAILTVFQGENYLCSEISLMLLKPSADEIFVSPKRLPSNQVLTLREIEIIKLIAEGLSNIEIAEKLFISPKTVKSHREKIMKKLEIHNVVGLVKYAIDNQLLY